MNERKIEFIARTFTDIGKAVAIASLIGNFFKETPLWLACAIIGFGIFFILIGFILYPGGQK